MKNFERRSFQPRFELLESRQLLSGSPLPFDDSGLAPAGLQAICALPNLPVFNVHSYGAVGNGVADDTVAIRAALSAAEANGGGIVYLPTGTYAVDPQASDPLAWGPIFSITSSNIVFIGDGASNTHLVAYVEGLRNPLTNWYDTGDPYQQIGRGNMFQVNPSADVTGIQFRSLDINGQTGYTGNFTVGGNTATGDGWDTYDKAICLGFGTHHVDNTLIFNCNIRNWRGEEIYAGGGTNGAIDIINCNITGTNASAVSCSGSVLLSHSTIGGTSAGDDVYNGLEDYCFPTQSTTVDHSTIICSHDPASPRGYGLSFEGEVGGSTLTVTNSVFANNNADILLQDTAHHVLIDSNTFTNSVLGGVITSIMNLYPGVTSGFSDVTISNNTYNGNCQGASLCSLGNYGSDPTRNFPNLVISGNTVQKGQLLGGAFGGTLGSWTGFVVKNNILEAGTRDIDPGSQGSNIGLWSGTIRPTAGTTDFDKSGVLNYGASGPTATIRILSDLTILYSNTAGSNPIAAELDPAVLAGYPVGFTTTVYSFNANNWMLKADPSWNTFPQDLPIGPNGLTIEVNSNGLFSQVTPAVPTIEITGGTFAYDGSPHTGDAVAIGADGVTPVDGRFSFTYNGVTAPPTAPGAYSITATFTSTDPHYTDAAGGGILDIVPTTPTVVISGNPLVAGGTTNAAVAAAVSIDCATPVAGTFSLTYDGSSAPPATPGTYAVSATFNSDDPDYASTIASGNIVIGGNQTASSVTVTVGTTSTLVVGDSIFVSDGLTFITNNSISAQGVLVSGTNQIIGGIDGTGNLVVSPGGGLTANYIRQGNLFIDGSAGAPGVITIAPSDSSGNPSINTLATASSSQAAVAAAAAANRMVPMGDSSRSTFARQRFVLFPLPSASPALANINTAVVVATTFPSTAEGTPRAKASFARSSNGPMLVARIAPGCLSKLASTLPVDLQSPPVLVASSGTFGAVAPRTSIRSASVPDSVAIVNDVGKSVTSGIASTRLAVDALFEDSSMASTEDGSLFNLIATGGRRSALLQRSILSMLRLRVRAHLAEFDPPRGNS